MPWIAESPMLLAVGAACFSVVLLIALLAVTAHNRHLRRQLQQSSSSDSISASRDIPPAETFRAPLDHLLPRNPALFYLLALIVSAGCWGVGFAIAPSVPRFLASREWHIQPFYLAAHLIALRLFVRLFVRKYVAGAAQVDMPAEKIAQAIGRILGLRGALVAMVIAVPFCVLDYRYLVSDRYEKLSEDQLLHAIDYLMWGIWCAEWLLNALMWVTIAGFLAMGYQALRTYRFREPIATVVQEKLYRPFLQMSSQGASIVLGFACVTGVYIWYAGGSAADFLGLAVTGVLLVVGFVPSWVLLNAKVKRTVRDEIEALRRNLSPQMFVAPGSAAATGPARTVEQRLDEVVALMRAWHLERLQLDLGRTEAQALAVRLAAPAATAGWQLYSNLQGILGKAGGALGSILSAIGRLFM